jgi:hypothetical protein
MVGMTADAIAATVRYTPAARRTAARELSVPNDLPSGKSLREGVPAAGDMAGIRTFGSVE